ncbi:MAG: hypothetical protein KIG65_03265 [Eubacteriales bacterium]|nr:hypothetical protein [Eubacteriales bacterium]
MVFTEDLSKYGRFHRIDEKTRRFIAQIPTDKTLMFNYASGIISETGVTLDNVEALTGVKVEPFDDDYAFPSIAISKDCENVRITSAKRPNCGVNIVNTKPFMSRDELRKIADSAGCHAYSPAGNIVYGDNRFIGIFPSETGKVEICLKEKGDYVNLVTGDEYKNTDKIFINASKTTPIFLITK